MENEHEQLACVPRLSVIATNLKWISTVSRDEHTAPQVDHRHPRKSHLYSSLGSSDLATDDPLSLHSLFAARDVSNLYNLVYPLSSHA